MQTCKECIFFQKDKNIDFIGVCSKLIKTTNTYQNQCEFFKQKDLEVLKSINEIFGAKKWQQ